MKHLVVQNTLDQYGRFIGQTFAVWDSKRKCMVFLPWPGRKGRDKAEAFISQGELNV